MDNAQEAPLGAQFHSRCWEPVRKGRVIFARRAIQSQDRKVIPVGHYGTKRLEAGFRCLGPRKRRTGRVRGGGEQWSMPSKRWGEMLSNLEFHTSQNKFED